MLSSSLDALLTLLRAGGCQFDPPPSVFFNIAQEPLELLTYIFLLFPNMSLTCSVINLARSIFSECTFHALFETHVRMSPLDPS